MNNEKEIVNKNKRIALKKLIDEMNKEKLSVLRNFLDQSSIIYDKEINDYYKLVNNLKKKLNKHTKEIVLSKCDEIDKAFDELINGLSNGSTTAFNKFTQNIFNIAKPISVGLALNTAVKLAPTPVTKLVPMGIGVLYSGYKICKNQKYKRIISKETKLNLMLQNCEFKYNEKGTLIDTRFTKEEQDLIRAKLKEMGVNFVDLGYNSLRTAIYSLSTDQKIQLIMHLQGKQNLVEFNKELKKYNKSPFLAKKRSIPITTVFTTGALEQLGVLNIIQITGLSALNGFLASELTKRITNNNITLSALAGLLMTSSTMANPDSQIIQAETFLIGSIITGVFTGIVSAVKNIKNSVDNNKLTKVYLQIEQEKYGELDNEEKKLLADYINSPEISEKIGESIMIDILVKYIENNLKIKLEPRPKNVYQLKLVVNNLKPGQKRKIHSLMEEFKHFNKHPNNQFLHFLEKALKATGMTAILGLAGFSVVDIFTKGEFLNNIYDQLYFYDSPFGNYDVIETEINKSSITMGDIDYSSGKVREYHFRGNVEDFPELLNLDGGTYNQEELFWLYKNAHTYSSTSAPAFEWSGNVSAEQLCQNLNSMKLDDLRVIKSQFDIFNGAKSSDSLTKFGKHLETLIASREKDIMFSEIGSGVAIGVAGSSYVSDMHERKNKEKENNKMLGTVHSKRK